MANVAPLQALAERLCQHSWPKDTVVKVCAYHAKEVSMRRYWKEQALDALLKRHGNPDVSQHPVLQTALADLPTGTRHVILLVLASPVEEVGRDHDFDWAIIEPSSMHSMIQLAGRVNRHRLQTVLQPNVFILENNIRKLNGKAACFVRPGLQQMSAAAETGTPTPITHLASNASALLQPASGQPVFELDARLIFNAALRCRFAEEDDRAIAILLKDALPFFDEAHPQWGCDWIYERYPLRTREYQEVWKVTPTTNGKLTLHRHEATTRGRVWVEKIDIEEQRPPNEQAQWLCPNLHDAERWMQTRLNSIGFAPAIHSELLDAARRLTIPFGPLAIHWSGAISTSE